MLMPRLAGSWDGEIRLWKLEANLKSFSLVGSIPALGVVNSLQILQCPRSTVSNFAWASQSSETARPSAPAASKGPLSALLVACVGQEMRLGRWIQKKGEGVLNGALVVALHPRTSDAS